VRRKLAFGFLAMTIVGSIILDQATKMHAQRELMVWADSENLSLYQGRRLQVVEWGKWAPPGDENPLYLSFSFNYVRNQGAAWGFLSDVDSSIRVPFFYAMTLFAAVVIGLYFRSTPATHRLARFALALVLSGAVGNFIDRIQHGFVIDWIDVRWAVPGWRYNFPNFNIADAAITVGMAFLIFDMLVLERRRSKSSS